jgi:hypothetical protein
LVGVPEGKRPFGRHTRKWEDGTKISFKTWQWGPDQIELKWVTNGWLLWAAYSWTYGFRKMRRICWPPERLSTSRVESFSWDQQVRGWIVFLQSSAVWPKGPRCTHSDGLVCTDTLTYISCYSFSESKLISSKLI